MKKWLILWLAALPAFSFAQKAICPGSPEIYTDRIKPSHDFYKNIVTGADGKVLYEFMMENFTRMDTARKEWVFARSRQVPPGSFSVDTSFTYLTLKPVRMHEIHYQQNVDINMKFEPEQATVTTIRKGQTTSKNYPMKTGYFEDNMIEYIFGYLNLKKGITYTLDNFNPATPGSDPYTLKYVFDQGNDRILEFTHGTTTGKIWIDRKTNQVLKQVGQNPKYHYVITKQ